MHLQLIFDGIIPQMVIIIWSGTLIYIMIEYPHNLYVDCKQ